MTNTQNLWTSWAIFMLQTNQHSAKGPLFKRAPFVSHQIAVSNLCITKAYTKAPSSPWPCPESPGPFGGRCYILRDLGIFQTNPTEAGKWIQTTQQKQLTKKNNDQIFLRIPNSNSSSNAWEWLRSCFFFLDKTAVFVRCFFVSKKQGCYNKLGWLNVHKFTAQVFRF